MKKILAILSAAGLFLALTACGSATKKTEAVIKIAYLPITHALPVLATHDLLEEGAFGQDTARVELVKFSSWPELLDALNSGHVDGASVLAPLALKAQEQNGSLKLAALGHHDGNVIIASAAVDSPKDLKGKTIAIPHRLSAHHILVREMLEQAGLSVDEVTLTELPPPEMPAALSAGQIDAYCVAEPFGAKGVALGAGHVLLSSQELWQDSLCCALVLQEEFLTKRADTAATFLNEYLQAGQYLDEAPEAAAAVAEKYFSLEEDVLALSLQWISYKDLGITEEEYLLLTEKMQRFGLTDSPPSFESFVWQEGLDHVGSDLFLSSTPEERSDPHDPALTLTSGSSQEASLPDEEAP